MKGLKMLMQLFRRCRRHRDLKKYVLHEHVPSKLEASRAKNTTIRIT